MTSGRAVTRRRGLTAAAVLVCLVVVTMISGALLKMGTVHRNQVRTQQQRLQAEWLAESGFERALARLAASPEYSGETWRISPEDLGLPRTAGPDAGPAAVVQIKVERRAGSGAERLVRVQADFPPSSPHRIRHSLQFIVDPASLKTGVSQ